MGLASPSDLVRAKQPPVLRPATTIWEHIKLFFEGPASTFPVAAVCIPPGAQLLFRGIPEDLQRQWQIAEEESAFFVQTSADVNRHRDAVRFRKGSVILLQNLREGMRVQVMSLGNSYAESDRELAVPAV
jgi:hypothetical protein